MGQLSIKLMGALTHACVDYQVAMDKLPFLVICIQQRCTQHTTNDIIGILVATAVFTAVAI